MRRTDVLLSGLSILGLAACGDGGGQTARLTPPVPNQADPFKVITAGNRVSLTRNGSEVLFAEMASDSYVFSASGKTTVYPRQQPASFDPATGIDSPWGRARYNVAGGYAEGTRADGKTVRMRYDGDTITISGTAVGRTVTHSASRQTKSCIGDLWWFTMAVFAFLGVLDVWPEACATSVGCGAAMAGLAFAWSEVRRSDQAVYENCPFSF